MSKENIPHQIQTLIDNMLSDKDSVFIRANYRARLDLINVAISDAIKKFDSELNKEDDKRNARTKKKRQYFNVF